MTDKYTNRNDELGNLPDTLRVNPFTVPDRYFEDLTKRSLFHASLRQRPEAGLNAPDDDYFESLADSIIGRISTDTLKEQVPDTGMHTPVGYFERLSTQVLATIREISSPAESAPIETPVRTIRTRQWLPYVAASCLLLAVGIGGYFGIYSPQSNATTASYLQAVPDQEIIHYLELYAESDQMLYQATHDADLGKWLDEEFSEADMEAYFNNTL